MALLSLRNLTFSLGGQKLLDGASLQIEPGERVALVGRNGAGKSTLLRLLAGDVAPQDGDVSWQKGARASLLRQDAPPLSGRVLDLVEQAAMGIENEELKMENAEKNRSAILHSSFSILHSPVPEHEIRATVSRLKLDSDADYEFLSGGQKRRVDLARALVSRPDLLLLDEPTNHLDISSIAWLEEFLPRSGATLLFVTHDRAFLRALATRIVEVDRGKLISYACSYDEFLERREANLEAEARRNADFDRKLSEEEAWLRKGVKARLTRNEGRVRALMKARQERQARRGLAGTASLLTHSADKSGALVAELVEASFGIDGKPILAPFSTSIMRGDRVGIIGPNGSGKTTLLRGLLGELAPSLGRVKIGTRLQIAYFDQLRSQLDESKSARYNVAGENETVTIGGTPRHIVGYLRAFGFAPDRIRQNVGTLSGGERNRLLLAKLFTQPSNLLVMDEPTNDLDIETLEILEELLSNYPGTLLLASHDRDFLNNVVTSTLAIEPNGEDATGVAASGARIVENVGGYDDYQSASARSSALELRASGGATKSKAQSPKTQVSTPKPTTKRLSNFEKRELELLPARIEALESQQAELYARFSDPAFLKDGNSIHASIRALETQLAQAFARWEELEKRES